MRKYILGFTFIAMAFVFTACNVNERNTVFFLSFHQNAFASDTLDGGMVMNIQSADGRTNKLVRRIPLLTSAYIQKAEVVPGKDGKHYGMKLYLAEYAKGIWHELCIYHKSEELVVLMDGFYSGVTVVPAKGEEEGVMLVDPIWTKQEAEFIAANAKRNYSEYNWR